MKIAPWSAWVRHTPLQEETFLIGERGDAWAFTSYPIGEGTPYMERWILYTPWRSFRLHHILRSDHDRDLHDHPFDFWTFLLTGGYVEVLPTHAAPCSIVGCFGYTVERRRRQFSFRHVVAETPHRLVLDRPVWTFVIAKPKRRRWGFYIGGFTPQHWVPHREY